MGRDDKDGTGRSVGGTKAEVRQHSGGRATDSLIFRLLLKGVGNSFETMSDLG